MLQKTSKPRGIIFGHINNLLRNSTGHADGDGIVNNLAFGVDIEVVGKKWGPINRADSRYKVSDMTVPLII